MTKCDFCEMSSPDGKCYWSSQIARTFDCEKAIKKMVKALEGKPKESKKKFWK